jgi:hypothetical protein
MMGHDEFLWQASRGRRSGRTSILLRGVHAAAQEDPAMRIVVMAVDEQQAINLRHTFENLCGPVPPNVQFRAARIPMNMSPDTAVVFDHWAVEQMVNGLARQHAKTVDTLAKIKNALGDEG